MESGHRRLASFWWNPAVWLVLGGLLAVVLAGQEPLRIQVGVVTVGVRVTDSRGREIQDLVAGDFTLLDNGIARELVYFSAEERPVSLVILLDHSASMADGKKIERAREAARFLVRSSHPDNEFMFLAFDDRVPRSGEFTGDRDRIEEQIGGIQPEGGTRLYDAVIQGLTRCTQARHSRQALVVITDGADQHSYQTLEQVIEKVRESQVQVYAIGYFSTEERALFRDSTGVVYRIDGKPIDNPRVVFQRLARESGAEAYFPLNDGDLREAVEKISADLRRQYTLAFYPPEDIRPGEYRTLQVQVNRPGIRVRARVGYAIPNVK
jgi:Ca-activated chloride channel family protein